MNVNFDKGAVVLITTFVTTGRHTIWRSTMDDVRALACVKAADWAIETYHPILFRYPRPENANSSDELRCLLAIWRHNLIGDTGFLRDFLEVEFNCKLFTTAAEIEAHIENNISGHAELQEFFETETD